MANDAYPAFFKILTMKDFSTVLRIPPAFSTKHKSDMTGNAKLVVDCGRIWNVKMERNGSVFCFTRGWSKFVKDAALQFGEFLVFSLSGNSEFRVQIYKTNFCEREISPLPLPAPLPVPPPTAPAPAGGDADGNCRKSSKGIKSVGRSKTDYPCSSKLQGNPLYFEACIKGSYRYRLYMPAKFVRASGLGEEGKHVKVEYVGKGKHCRRVVAVENQANLYGFELGTGWSTFRDASRLVYGKIYSFEFDPTRKVILVKEKESD